MNIARIIFLASLYVALSYPVQARVSRWAGPFAVSIVAVQDGDSVVVQVTGDCPFDCIRDTAGATVISARLRGIDAPETHACRNQVSPSCAACPHELAAAAQSTRALTSFLDGAQAARLVNLKRDKYPGRVVADLQVLKGGHWLSASAMMLRARLAVPYEGGRKIKLWCGEPTP